MIGAIILQVVLIFLNAVFAAAEIAVVSTNGAKLEKMAEDGNKKEYLKIFIDHSGRDHPCRSAGQRIRGR